MFQQAEIDAIRAEVLAEAATGTYDNDESVDVDALRAEIESEHKSEQKTRRTSAQDGKQQQEKCSSPVPRVEYIHHVHHYVHFPLKRQANAKGSS